MTIEQKFVNYIVNICSSEFEYKKEKNKESIISKSGMFTWGNVYYVVIENMPKWKNVSVDFVDEENILIHSLNISKDSFNRIKEKILQRK
jgi:hypothetical protein